MKPIIFDFMRRWWFVVAGYLLLVGYLAAVFKPMSVAPHMAVLLVLTDAQRGCLHVFRGQPISQRNQMRAWWLIAVCLLTFLSIPMMIAGMWWQQQSHDPGPIPGLDAPWFSLALTLMFGLGISSLAFLVCILMPQHQPASKKDWFLTLLAGSLFGLVMPGPFLLIEWLPGTPGEMNPWQWITLALVPGILWLSFVASIKMVRRRVASAALPGPYLTAPCHAPGTSGLRMLLRALHGRMLLIILFMSLAIWLPQMWWAESRPAGEHGWSRVQINVYQQISAYMMMFTAFLPDWFSFRMLRSLPLSTRSLTLALLSVPMALGVFLFLQLAWQLPVAMWPECGARSLFTAGVGAALLTFACHFCSPWRFLFLAAPPGVILIFDLLKNQDLTPWLALIGAFLLLASGFFMHRGFWRSAGYYRPRRAFGMNASSPIGRS